MAVTKDMLLSELQDLLRLTAFEQTIASVRRAQAATSAVSAELKANADKARERQQLLAEAVRQAGGVPDVVGAALGRAGAFLQTQVNQVQTLQGALLGDLALEHQLRERARYARTLAETLGYHQVLPVLDRLEVAHTATIEWLEERIAEVGRTGTSVLKATPLQSVITSVRRALGAPLGLLVGGVNRGSTLLRRGTGAPLVEPAGAPLAEAADAAAEKAADAAERVTEDVLDLTGSDEPREPFPAYSTLTGDSVMRHVADHDDVEHLRQILAYERAHKARKGVLQAVEERLSTLSASV